MSNNLMAIKILLIALLAVASANGCCRGYKILQFRRAGILPMFESSPSCGSMYGPEEYCDGSLYPTEPIPKYDASVGRYYSPYGDPKTITHKCVCSKSIASQRMVTNGPRFYKRGYCSESLIGSPCGPYGCPGQYGDCGQCDSCAPCGQYGSCEQPCAISSSLFRQAHRVLPLTLPASCVC